MKVTYDCTPTLNDNDVIEFCKNGFLTLDGVIDNDTNQKTIEYVERNTAEEPIEILENADILLLDLHHQSYDRMVSPKII